MDDVNGMEEISGIAAVDATDAGSEMDAVKRMEAQGSSSDPVLAKLEQRVAELETAMGDLRTVAAQAHASAAPPASTGRKTVPAGTVQLLAKQGVALDETATGAALDDALRSLPVEQRIAVKSHMLRAGLL